MSFFCVALFRLFVSIFRYFELRLASFRHFAWRYFVILRGVFSLFRLFAWRFFVISLFRVALFRLFAWRYFVILRGVISWQKDEKTKCHKSATILISFSFDYTKRKKKMRIYSFYNMAPVKSTS